MTCEVFEVIDDAEQERIRLPRRIVKDRLDFFTERKRCLGLDGDRVLVKVPPQSTNRTEELFIVIGAREVDDQMKPSCHLGNHEQPTVEYGCRRSFLHCSLVEESRYFFCQSRLARNLSSRSPSAEAPLRRTCRTHSSDPVLPGEQMLLG
ncbi:hypothetical protein E2C01_029577 [Portunus trituberculatus]|uniref:Uncharacterized protein n=1 Tax=Portunus trituberculatus TaxID=210409 RepID=A0A5B7ESR6_PORTR|nr:hypothetical protein [Portunus trituberculatus]